MKWFWRFSISRSEWGKVIKINKCQYFCFECVAKDIEGWSKFCVSYVVLFTQGLKAHDHWNSKSLLKYKFTLHEGCRPKGSCNVNGWKMLIKSILDNASWFKMLGAKSVKSWGQKRMIDVKCYSWLRAL
jgi:hypothetical protein